DVRRFMLAHALLAPNPHNRQPWIADLREAGKIHLQCDGDRLLPETDPFGRQILIGCGAFLELAVIAAAQRGIAVKVDPFPDGPPAANTLPAGTRVATLTLGAEGSAKPDPLFAQIPRRHTRKTAYDHQRALPDTLAAAWTATAQAFGLRAGLVTGEGAMAPIRKVTREAFEIETTTAKTWLESARLIRIGPDAIAKHRDGISLNDPFVRLVHTVGMFDPMKVPAPGSSDFKRVMDRWVPFESGSGYLWLAGADNARATQVAAGRAYVRQHLLATAAGADMHPLSQALQEFPEMRGPYAAMHRLLGVDPGSGAVQMLARVGFATKPTGPTPRRDLGSMVRA
ncbi:MAG: Acg family FMN-binding oxidoreductase, partial [Rubrivivax sp.]